MSSESTVFHRGIGQVLRFRGHLCVDVLVTGWEKYATMFRLHYKGYVG